MKIITSILLLTFVGLHLKRADGIRALQRNDVVIKMKDGSMFGALMQQVFTLKLVPYWVRPKNQQILPRYPDQHYSVYIRSPNCEHFISHSPIELQKVLDTHNPLYLHVPKWAQVSLGSDKNFVATSFEPFNVDEQHTHFEPCGRIYVSTPGAKAVYTALLDK